MHRIVAFLAPIVLIGCGGVSPTAPAPEVTLTVTGVTRDAFDRALSGVRVDVTSGRLAGTFVITNVNGEFTFPDPLPALSSLKASKTGYVETYYVPSTAAQMPVVFKLLPSDPPIAATGEFDVTLEADATCTSISDTARRRTYRAALRTGLELSGAEFLGGDPAFNVINIIQSVDQVRFMLTDPPVWELIPDNSHVMVSGEATGTADRNFTELRLSLNGTFRYCPSFAIGMPVLCSAPVTSCASAQHALTIRRR